MRRSAPNVMQKAQGSLQHAALAQLGLGKVHVLHVATTARTGCTCSPALTLSVTVLNLSRPSKPCRPANSDTAPVARWTSVVDRGSKACAPS